MQLIKNRLAIFALSLFIFGNANAISIKINLEAGGYPSDITHPDYDDPIRANSFTFGDYIFQSVTDITNGLSLTDVAGGVLTDSAGSGNFTLKRLSGNGFFSLLSISHSGLGTTAIGGVNVTHLGNASIDINNIKNHIFNDETGITNVDFILFSPSDLIQISSFEVQAVPVPAAAWLFGSGLLGLVGVARRKKA